MTKRKYAEYKALREAPPRSSQAPILHSSLQYYRNRNDILVPTHSWPSYMDAVALRTSPAYGKDAIFTASRSLLARDSAVFARMFEEGTVSTFDGNPLFFIEDDPKDVQDLLLALHEFRCVEIAQPQLILVPVSSCMLNLSAYSTSSRWTNGNSIAAILRLGKRYRIQHLVERTLVYLERVRYPVRTLEAYQKKPWLALVYLEEIAILNAIAETEYEPLLPLLSYRAAISWSLDDLISCQIRAPSAPGCAWFVTQACRSRVIRMHSSIPAWFTMATERMLRKTSTECVSGDTCRAALQAWRDKTARFMVDDHGLLFDIFLLVSFGIDDIRDLCTICKERANRRIGKLQQDAWNKVPIFIGMGSWEDVLGHVES